METLKIISWQAVRSGFEAHLLTPHGYFQMPVLAIIQQCVSSEINRKFFATQSHGRLAIMPTSDDQAAMPYIVVDCTQEGTIECQLWVPAEESHYIQKRQVCSMSTVLAVIVQYVEFLLA